MKVTKLEVRDSRWHRPLVISLALAVFMVSFIGLAQQNSSKDTDDQDDVDLDALVTQISKSRSLGLITKLSLKDETDRFLKSIHKYHAGADDSSLEQLRERYDAMFHKLMVLVQKKDKELAKSIDEIREKLWAILSDEEQFSNM